MTSRSSRIIISFVLIFSMAFSLFACSCTSEITGEQWLKRQTHFFDDLSAFGKEMDTVYTLYFTGKISDEDFINEVDTLNDLYSLLKLRREKEKEEYPVAPESHTFLSKECTKSLDNIMTTYGKILSSTLNEDGTPVDARNLSYTYLKYRDTIIDDVSGFEAAMIIYKNDKDKSKKNSKKNSSSKTSSSSSK